MTSGRREGYGPKITKTSGKQPGAVHLGDGLWDALDNLEDYPSCVSITICNAHGPWKNQRNETAGLFSPALHESCNEENDLTPFV